MKKRLSIFLLSLLALGGTACSDKTNHIRYTSEDFSAFRITETSYKHSIYSRPLFTLSPLSKEQHKLLADCLIAIRERDIALKEQHIKEEEAKSGGQIVCITYTRPEYHEETPAIELKACNAEGVDLISAMLTGPTSIEIPANLDGSPVADYDISPFLTEEQKAILNRLWEAKLKARDKGTQRRIPCQDLPYGPTCLQM